MHTPTYSGRSQLLRSADDTDPIERVIVANADQLVIVTALADPAPQTRLIDRCLVAAYDAGLRPLLCLTKPDLAPPDTLLETYGALDVDHVVVRKGSPLDELVGVRDDDALHRVGVVGAAPQRGLAMLNADDAGQRVRSAGGVADQGHMVADHHALAPELTGAHRGDHPLRGLLATHPGAEQDRIPAAVYPGDEPGYGVLVGRSGLGPTPRPPRVRADADVGLVEVLPAHQRVRLGRRRRRAWRPRGR